MSEIYYSIIILLLVVYIFILQNKINRLQRTKPTGLPAAGIDSKLDDEVRAMLAQGKSNVKIIKYVRQAAGLDLLQAKLYVDRIMESQGSKQVH